MQEKKSKSNDFSTLLRELLEQNRVKKKDLAQALGVLPGSVSRWLHSGNIPDNQTLVKLATYFGVTVDYLLKAPSGQQLQLEEGLSLEAWKRRAIIAEEKLKILKASLQGVIDNI